MRTIEWTTQFKRDYKREAKDVYRKTLTKDLEPIVTTLANDEPLADKHHDHALSGEWKDHRDCHVKPDLILIYRSSQGRGITTCASRLPQRTGARVNNQYPCVIQSRDRISSRSKYSYPEIYLAPLLKMPKSHAV